MRHSLKHALTSVVCVGVGWFFAAPAISSTLLLVSCLLGMAVGHFWYKVQGGSPVLHYVAFFIILVARAGGAQPIKGSDFIWLAFGTCSGYIAGFLLNMLYRFRKSL